MNNLLKLSGIFIVVALAFALSACPNSTGSSMNGTQNEVSKQFSISFEQLSDFAPDISGPTLRIIGSAAETTKSIDIENPWQYDYGSIKWFYNGSQITGAAVSGTYGQYLSLNSSIYNRIGIYFITVDVRKANKAYSKVISFKVDL